MKYTVECQTTLTADREQAWDVWSDMASYPRWDPREQELRLNGPLAVGTTGWSKQVGGRAGSDFVIVSLDPGHGWTNETPLPAGKLVIDHRIADAGAGRLRLTKTYTAYGPVSVLFRLFYARELRRENPRSFLGVAAEIARRYPAAA